jgi:hypothetical protein
MRSASVLCLAGALILLPIPWYETTFLSTTESRTGLDVCLFFWQEQIRFMPPLTVVLIALCGIYPFVLIAGIVFSFVDRKSRRRAIVLGTAAAIGLAALTGLYFQCVLVKRDFGSLTVQFSVWYYLSHLLCLTCLILSAIEARRMPSAS